MTTKINAKFLNKLGFHIEGEGVEIDLVCGMEVDTANIKFKTKYKGQEYYFCSENCLNHFKMNPKKYVG